MPKPVQKISSRLGGARAWWMWIIATTFLLFLFNLQTGYNIINPDLAKELSLSVSQVSVVASIYTAIFGITQIFSGPILDRFGIRFVIPSAIITVTGGAWLLSQADSYFLLLLAQVIMAVGAIFGFVGAGFVGGEWFGSDKFGFMFGLVQSAAAFGSFFGGNIINELLTHYNWRAIVEGFTGFGVILAGIAFVFLRDNPSEQRTSLSFQTGIISELISVLKIPQIWLSMFIGSVLFGGLLSLAVVWASKIIQSNGIAAVSANRASLMIWLGCGLGAGVMEPISQKFRSRKGALLANGLLFTGALLVLLYVPVNAYLAGLLTFIIGFASAAHMLAFTMAAEMVPVSLEGTSAAVTNSGLYLVGALMITLPGYLLPHSLHLRLADFQLAIMPVWIISAISIVLCQLFLKETFRGNH